MKLHTFFRSSAAFRVRIALNLKGLAYESVAVSLPGMEQRRAEFLALNPQGLVPVLVDDARVLAQSLAIIEYLDETRPQPPLLPATPEGRARVRALAQVIACDIHPLNNVRVLKYLQGPLGQGDGARQAWYEHWIAEGFQALEGMLARSADTGTFCHGATPTLADVCLVPQVFNAKRFNCPLAPYPTIVRIFEECMRLEAFDRAQPSKQPDAA